MLKLKAAAIGILATVGWFGLAAGHSGQASAATAESLELVSLGKQYIGTPYVFGATAGSTTAFDCSSFTQYIYGKQGIWLPRTAAAQANKGKKVAKSYLSMGDLVFFKTGSKGIGHVAIYAGDGKILQASSSQGVTVSSMNSAYWTKNYVTARRIL
ncbi:C40 family peptidase [Cohnella lubricantis]|uniref:C40 family peptidase n=2 Tax=Cohnella lubricantis TaxID=2163172 RepID=A0A841TBB2_9BACL|nr:C40 family peptidase [Cohnella lubricantis]